MHSITELPTSPDATLQKLASGIPAAALQPRKQISSRSLLEDQREVEIEHAGQIYRLRVTALGKLILTK
ncbi:hemin uptake protein HemP [Paucibacter sp. Y2R2-4]|uniref:hemin uptake protein HemP n=1 Tax=Paucibacter sp. Y2R2-4 TaxID=2893553 RepID=UPI0021E36D3F|nr:hemin uptake protein HemP [Paucibacter sp. Y2R2-4]MCV2349356.1 hemin uptake protein HemP [Paucibacter sp. Y2R2-4]